MSVAHDQSGQAQGREPQDMTEGPSDLNGIISRLHRAARGADRVRLGDLVDAMGRSSMAAVLLVPALLLVSPLSGIPGASIMGGIIIALISAQMVLRRPKIWLPDFVRRRTLPGRKLSRALVWLRRPARRFDGLAPAKPGGGGDMWWKRILALLCLCLGLGMPMLELIPFSSTIVASLVAALAAAMLTGRVRIAVVAIGVASLAITTAFWVL